MSAEERWNAALRRSVQQTADALADVNVEAPLPRYPLRKRIFWRLRGVPIEVRREQLAIRKARAELLMAALVKHHKDAA